MPVEFLLFLSYAVIFFMGMDAEHVIFKKPKEDGFYIIDDRNPEKTSVVIDQHKEVDEIKKQKMVIFRVLEKK